MSSNKDKLKQQVDLPFEEWEVNDKDEKVRKIRDVTISEKQAEMLNEYANYHGIKYFKK